ncbi:MAG TPA: hypothetical protein VH591_16910 [Ktedonobacterales bacterium]|jgi:hypothetical protein
MKLSHHKARRYPVLLGKIVALAAVPILSILLVGCDATAIQGLAAGSPTAGKAEQTPTIAASPTATSATVKVQPTLSTSANLITTPSIHEVAYTVVPITIVSPPVAVSSVAVSCPAGEIALGGGWSVPQTKRVFKALLTGNTWTVYTYTPTGVSQQVTGASQDDNSYTAYVECLAGAPGAVVTAREVDSTVQPDKTNTLTQFCQTNEAPVGFGFDLSASPGNLELQAANPETFEQAVWWNFWVKNHDVTARAAIGYAECLTGVPFFASYPGQAGGYVYAGMTGSVTVNCPAGMAVAGGGLDYRAGNGSAPNIGNLYALHATTGGWQGAIYGVTGYGLIPLVPTVWAACVGFS